MKLQSIPIVAAIALWTLSHGAGSARAEKVEIGVDQRVGERIPLAELTFTDESGAAVALRDLFDRPVVLTLVYYRCPSICSPLLREVARVADLSAMEPGTDYRLVTISFAPGESPDLASRKKENLLGTMKARQLPSDAWRFLTGDAENIAKLTEAVGFRYAPDEKGVDYMHPATVVFLSPEGLIIRYIKGLAFNPAELDLAVLDARHGRPRAFMERLGRLCFSEEGQGRRKLTQINRVIFGSTLLLGAFGFVVVLRRRRYAGPHGNGANREP